jgi:hypothetical protein
MRSSSCFWRVEVDGSGCARGSSTITANSEEVESDKKINEPDSRAYHFRQAVRLPLALVPAVHRETHFAVRDVVMCPSISHRCGV